MTTTDLSKKQLATILSALDDAPRSPAIRARLCARSAGAPSGSDSPPTMSSALLPDWSTAA